MNRILFLTVLLISSLSLSQESVIEWQKTFGGSDHETIYSIQQTTDGGYITAGKSRSNDWDVTGNHGDNDFWIVKIDSTGNMEWQKSLGGSGNDQAFSIRQTSDGGYIVAGYSESNDGDVTGNQGSNDYWVVKLDLNGNIQWQRSLGGPGNDLARSVKQTTDGGYIVAGSSNSVYGDVSGNNGDYDFWIVKLDINGSISWQKALGGSGEDEANSIELTTDGGLIIAGSTRSSDGDAWLGTNGYKDYWVVKLDSLGNIHWQRPYGGQDYDIAESIKETSDGGYIVSGWSRSTNGDISGNNGSQDYWVIKLDSAGSMTWQNSLGGSVYDGAFAIDQTTDSGYIVTGYVESDDGDVTSNYGNKDIWIVKLDTAGSILWEKSIGGSSGEHAYSIQKVTDNGFILAGLSSSNDGDVSGNKGGADFWVVKMSISNVSGRVYNDLNENCFMENTELGINGNQVHISPGNYIAQVNDYGLWYIDSLPIGTYTATIDTTNLNWTPTCPISQTFTITDPQSHTLGPDFGMINNNPCSSPDISIQAPFLRRCFTDQEVYVQACNGITATGVLNSAYADIELDSLMTPTSSSIPYTSLGNGVYRFQLGNINPGQCVDFTINTTVSCDAVLDQTLCMDAKLYPVDSCALDSIPTDPLPPNYGNDPNLIMPQPCTLPWDRSSLQVEGWCQGDSVVFSITNTGDFGSGDMDCYSPVLLYINDTLVSIDSVQLQGQETIYYSYPAYGETWILAAEQHPLHPGNSHPNAHVELCGSDSTQWIPDMINNQPLDDADPVDDIYCGIVTGSYDPNDKRGFPTGVTSQHHIQPNQQLQYVIRFQNTGTDTAFTVVIRDTLDTDLNIFTVNSGVSSHDYTFRKYGPRVLEWTFDDIMLPDSTTDEPGSNGFVTFTVDQVPDLPNGTIINNQADIYFDFNAPIITNETDHVINDNIEGAPMIDLIHQTVTECSSYNWNVNGQTYTQSGIYTEVLTNQKGFDSTLILDLTINQPNIISENITTCSNSYTWNTNGQTYTQSGQYTEHYTNEAGCDSTMTLNLTINQPTTGSQTVTSCDSYTWNTNNQTYTQSGQYSEVLTNSVGCDSTVTLDLTIKNSTSSVETVTACDGYVWNINGQVQLYSQSGQYTASLTNQAGCDSTITLNLTINSSTNGSEVVDACSSYTWNTNGQTYTQSGQYTEVLNNQYGCDSTVTLDLTINQPNSGTETVTSCDSYTWNTNGQTYNQSGNYTTVLTNAQGCDSIVTLELTIDTVNTSISLLNDITLEAVTNNAQYQWVDCDQNYQAIAGATDQVFEATENGTYAAIITQNGCTDTTDCITISNVGFDNHEKQVVNLYPNPTSNTFIITADKVINSSFKIVDAQGKEVLSGKMKGKEQSIDISSLSKGTYSILFEDEELPVLSVIKE